MTKKERVLTEAMLIEEIIQFREQQKTLILATLSLDSSQECQPLASYAPFIEDEKGHFYVFLSGLASHSVNLNCHHDKQSKLSVLLIEDEQSARNLFARKRLSYSCTVSIWPREHLQWQEKIDKL